MVNLTLLLLLFTPFQDEEEKKKEVVIIGTRSETDILDVPSGVSVINRDDIEKSGASNIREVLNRVPGFFSSGPNKGANDAAIDLRGYNNGGGNGQRTLVLVDGRRTNGVTSSSTNWSSIPLDNIDRIEITRGPAATLYGDPALAGVINIITRRGKDEHQWRVHGAGGTWDSTKVAAEAFGKGYSIFVGNETTDGWRDNSRFESFDATARYEHALSEELLFTIKLGHHNEDRRLPGTLSASEIAAMGRNATVKPDDRAEREETFLDAVLTWTTEAWGEFSLQISGLTGESHSLAGFTGFPNSLIDDEFEQSALYLKHVFELSSLRFTTGVDLIYETAEAESQFFSATTTDYKRRTIGVYEHAQWRPLDRVVVSAGVRYDRALLDIERTPSTDEGKAFDQISPMAGVTVHLLDELSVYVSYGRPFKYPVRDELVGFSAGDPELGPERSHSYEAGVRLWSDDIGRVSVAWFLMDVKDEIFFDPAVGMFGSNNNIDEVRHQGVETELNVPVLKEHLDVSASYTYTRAVIEDGVLEGKRYPVTPFHQANFGITGRYDVAYLTFAGRLVGRRYLINDLNNNQKMLGSYWTFDAKIGARWKGAHVYLSAFNLFDREYNDNGGLDFFNNPRFNPAPERSFFAGIEATF